MQSNSIIPAESLPSGLIVPEGFVVHDIHLVMLEILKEQLGLNT